MRHQFGNGGMGAAERTVGGFGTADLAEGHIQGIIEEKVFRQCFPESEDFFDGFVGLQDANSPGQDAQHSRLLTIWDKAGRRGFRV